MSKNRFDSVYFNVSTKHAEPAHPLLVRDLIRQQRAAAHSTDPFERAIGALSLAGALKHRLSNLTDRQIGQLLFDEAWDELPLLDPALAIVQEATDRLLFSFLREVCSGRPSADRDDYPACPRCGSEMLPMVGIDEPDFWQCVLLACRHKQGVGTIADQRPC